MDGRRAGPDLPGLYNSGDDPYVSPERAQSFAQAWCSRLVTVEAGGHLNSQSGLGDWPFGFAILKELRRG